MSLEKLLTDLIASVDKLTETNQKLLAANGAKETKVEAKADKKSEKTSKKSRDTDDEDDEEEDEVPSKKSDKKSDKKADKKSDKKGEKAKKLKYKDVRKTVMTFIDEADSKKERKKRLEYAAQCVEFGLGREELPDLEEDGTQEEFENLLKWVAAYENGEPVEFEEEESDDEDDED